MQDVIILGIIVTLWIIGVVMKGLETEIAKLKDAIRELKYKK